MGKHAVYLKNRTWTRALGDTTPFKVLTQKKLDTSGSKLDGRSRSGRWMGFDEETGDGHRIYWAEKRSITVERSVRFNFEHEMVVGQLPYGENPTSEPNTSKTAPTKPATAEELVEPAVV